jgi:hypothetical protein
MWPDGPARPPLWAGDGLITGTGRAGRAAFMRRRLPRSTVVRLGASAHYDAVADEAVRSRAP